MKQKYNEPLESLTWEEFFVNIDVTDWRWSDVERLNIIDEDEDFYIVQLSITEILDQPDVNYWHDENGYLIVDWGVPVRIVNEYEDIPVYVRIWKDRRLFTYHCDGRLYTDINDIKGG